MSSSEKNTHTMTDGKNQTQTDIPPEKFYVEIDCPPGGVRPNAHFESMCRELGLSEDWFEYKSAFCGEFRWDVKTSHNGDFYKNRAKIAGYLTELYKSGRCRYASW